MILTDEQHQILGSFRDLISDCIDVIQCRWDNNGKYPDRYKESIPAMEIRILRALEKFNDGYGYDWQREIVKTIDGMPVNEIRLYVNDLLCYFKIFSDIYYPYALVGRWNGYVCECKMQLNSITDDAEKAACHKTITMFENQIQQAKEAAAQYEGIALTFKDKSIAGSSFRELVWWEHLFANILDAELAKRGIDLMQIQRQAGIYVKSPMRSTFTRATDIMDFAGSFELAENYIKALQPQEIEEYDNTNKPQKERVIKESELKEYFNFTFKGGGNHNIDYFTNNLIPDLEQNRTDKDFAKIAYMIYSNGKLQDSMRPNTFKEWYKKFCEFVGCGFHEYKPNALIPNDKLKKAFYYLQR